MVTRRRRPPDPYRYPALERAICTLVYASDWEAALRGSVYRELRSAVRSGGVPRRVAVGRLRSCLQLLGAEDEMVRKACGGLG